MSRLLLVLGLFMGIGLAVLVISGKDMTTTQAFTRLPTPVQAQLQKLANVSQGAIDLTKGNQEKLSELPQYQQLSTNSQVTTFASRAAELSGQAQAVLGDAVQVNQDEVNKEKSLHQKAIDSGLYLYCQQVVKEFEAAQE